MVSELQGTLGKRRSAIEEAGETWESKPLASLADASHFEGIKFGKVPSAAEWMKMNCPEEDIVLDALDEVLKGRGTIPAHAPATEPFISQEEKRITDLGNSLMKLQRQKLEEAGALAQEREGIAQRMAKLEADEEELRLATEKLERRKEEKTNYPQPEWLEKLEDTMNVAVVGNAGVGKSLLINCMRRVKTKDSADWAAVGVKETTLAPTMYTFPGKARFRLWDLPGASTELFPRETYIRDMGLRYFDSVIIVSASRFTQTENDIRVELETHQVPFLMVRSKIDIDVWNDKEVNNTDKELVVQSIRDDLRTHHGIDHPYLVSSRDPEDYDMPQLLKDAFPGLKRALDANAPVFEPGDAGGWGDSWALPNACSELLAGIQGQWADGYDGCVYIVDGSEVHVTLTDGEAAVLTLSEHDGCIWWNGRWSIDASAIAKSRTSSPWELRWKPVDIVMHKPLIWRR